MTLHSATVISLTNRTENHSLLPLFFLSEAHALTHTYTFLSMESATLDLTNHKEKIVNNSKYIHIYIHTER